MAKHTARSMLQVKMPGAAAAPVAAPKKTVVKVPAGGEASVRKIDNGLVVTTGDANWNRHGEVFVPEGSQLDLG